MTLLVIIVKGKILEQIKGFRMQDKIHTFKFQNLGISLSKTGNALYVTIAGSISDDHSELVKQAFDRIANTQSEKIILNLQAVPKISASEIAKLLVLNKRLSSQMRELVIEDIHDDLLATFESINLDLLLKIKKNNLFSSTYLILL